MKIICQILSGSRLYELDTVGSDYDYTGVFLNTTPAEILGLKRFDFCDKKDFEGELSLFEFRHFLNLLESTNTKVIELLFSKEHLLIEKEFIEVQKLKYELISSEKLYKSLKGYIESERKTAIGEKRNQGQSRKFKIEKYGFSPKNFSHLFRLCYSGIYFFEKDIFPLSIREIDEDFYEFIFSIKKKPQNYKKEELLEKCDFYLEKLNNSFENRKNNYEFNSNLANELCLNFYRQFLN